MFWIALGAAFAMFSISPKKLWPFGETDIYEAESQYHYVRVTKKGSALTLYFKRGPGAARQSVIDLKHPHQLELEYTQMAFIGLAFIDEPKRVLVVGLGGGAIPTLLRHHYPRLPIDVVEIDPMVRDVAKKYFYFRDKPPTRAIIADGRVWVRRAARQRIRYDIVVLDAYTGTYIPPHLMSKEFLGQVGDIVAPGGCIVSNVHTSNRLYEYEQRTYAATFPQNYTFLGVKSSNAILVSRKEQEPVLTERELKLRAKMLQEKHKFHFDLAKMAAMFSTKKDWKEEGDILTDDFSPVNLLRIRGR